MREKAIRIWALFVFLTLAGSADDEARDAARLYEDAVNVCQRGGHAEDCRARMADSLRIDPNQACLSALKPSEPAVDKASRVLLPVTPAGIASSLWFTPEPPNQAFALLTFGHASRSLRKFADAAEASTHRPLPVRPPPIAPSRKGDV